MSGKCFLVFIKFLMFRLFLAHFLYTVLIAQ